MGSDNKPSKKPPSSGLVLGDSSAGAGTLGLFGFIAVGALAIVFFVAESYFLSMLLMSFALLFYVAGAELGKLMMSSLTVFFSSRHLIRNAIYVQDTSVALRRHLHMRKDESGHVKSGPIEKGTKIKLPDNPLVRDMQSVLKREKGDEYAQFVAHQFVAGVMPLLGLIGTVVGLIGMFDKLGPNTSVETLAPELAISLQTTLYGAVLASAYTILASRFDQRIKSLEYDYDILCYALDVLVKNEAVIEVEA
jgi:biopolymer transport protein ExbB/TolQ